MVNTIWEDRLAKAGLLLEEEKARLNITLDSRVLVISKYSSGAGEGSAGACRILGNNLNEILYGADKYRKYKLVADGSKIRAVGSRDRGRVAYEFRGVRAGENINKLMGKINRGEDIRMGEMNLYTTSLVPYVNSVYGWK